MLKRIPRKNKKSFRKFIGNIQGVFLNPNNQHDSPKEIIEDLYHVFRRRHCAKTTFSTKGK